jgi:hypothetical protein
VAAARSLAVAVAHTRFDRFGVDAAQAFAQPGQGGVVPGEQGVAHGHGGRGEARLRCGSQDLPGPL